jgi:hypothetical protein
MINHQIEKNIGQTTKKDDLKANVLAIETNSSGFEIKAFSDIKEDEEVLLLLL